MDRETARKLYDAFVSFDADQEVHRVLTEKIFPVQAWVAATDEFIAAQKR